MPKGDKSEVPWRRSTRSQQNGACVEASYLGTTVAVRDSKDPQGPEVVIMKDSWNAFIRILKSGEVG
ncbi:DUF397 domain-containing protein [Sphaerisporangium dianthi]|uniref:DUF397 domain-containing protein n=1 Tax=Sphaerisporangium dianthi TaxID=1436120 RepID=A0ABV9CH99_9ACTN